MRGLLAATVALILSTSAIGQIGPPGPGPAPVTGGSGTVTSVVCPSATITTAGSCNPLPTTGTSGDVATATGTANGLQDSGTLLSSLAPLASPTFTGTVTIPNGSALGTPTTLVLTNATGLPIGGVTGLGTGVGTALGATVSGSGGFCLVTSCALVTSTVNGWTLTPATITLTGTTGQTYTLPTTTATIARTDSAQTFTGVQTFGSIVMGASNSATWSGRGIITSNGAGDLQIGTTDVNGSPVAAILSAQSAITGSNLAGANMTINGSRSTGSGASGSITIQTSGNTAASTTQNTLVPAEVIDNVQHVTLGGGTPTCGTGCSSIAANATDQRMTITTGTAVSGITVNFAKTWVNVPVCVAIDNSTVALTSISAISTSAITITTAAALTAAPIYLICQ